jgi:surface antigen
MHRDHVHVSVKDQPGEPLEDAPAVSAASYVQSQLSPSSTATSTFERASFATLLPSENLGHQTDPGSIGLNTDEQVTNAKTIIGMSKTIGFGKEGALVGVTVALVESTLINVNHGDIAGPDSTGLFQQRDHWGARNDRMNPAYAAQAFFLGVGSVPGLESIPNWKTMPVHQAAQAVQRSGFAGGSNYLERMPLATRIVDALYDSSPNVPAVVAGTLNPPTNASNNDSSNNCGSGGVTDPGSVAAGDTYPAKNESYCRTAACYAVQAADSVAGGYRGECVDWADWKMVERAGVYGTHMVTRLGNGGDMADDNPIVRANFKVDMNPVAGDTVFFKMGRGGATGSAGHVATVQKVNGDGTIVIEEYNFGGDTPATGGGRYNTRTIQANEASGYIHFWDPAKSDEENKAKLISVGILVPAKGTWPRQTA